MRLHLRIGIFQRSQRQRIGFRAVELTQRLSHRATPAGFASQNHVFEHLEDRRAIHKNQALVLVNYGNATGQEILNVSKDIQETIFKTFGIHIEAEVNVI